MNLNVTATTSEVEIVRPINEAKMSLVEMAIGKSGHDPLTDPAFGTSAVAHAKRVMVAESLAAAQLRYRDVCVSAEAGIDAGERTVEEAQILKSSILMELSSGDSDTWSGRDNDDRRLCNDAVRNWANYQFTQLNHWGDR